MSGLKLNMFLFSFSDVATSSVTVEEGERAILECPGFVPDPDNPNEKYALFIWYKARKSDKHVRNRVAVYDKSANLARIMGDMEGRASINRTSGALEIPETRITDGHYYTCDFRDTARGLITSETKLIITGKVLIAHSGVQFGGSQNYCLLILFA